MYQRCSKTYIWLTKKNKAQQDANKKRDQSGTYLTTALLIAFLKNAYGFLPVHACATVFHSSLTTSMISSHYNRSYTVSNTSPHCLYYHRDTQNKRPYAQLTYTIWTLNRQKMQICKLRQSSHIMRRFLQHKW